MKEGATWVVGHRGAMAYAPENTRASFEKAWRLGVDAVECDVHLSRDGRPIVLHDATLDRTTSGRGPVRQKTWAELRSLDAGSWFGRAFAGEPLWRLDDLLRWAKPKKGRSGAPLRLLIEIKKSNTPRPLADAVGALLRTHGMIRRSVVISFDARALGRVKNQYPRVVTGFLFSEPLARLDAVMTTLRADGIFPRFSLITPALADRARRRGWFLGTWTVNTGAEARRLRALGVNAIASNVPDRLARWIR